MTNQSVEHAISIAEAWTLNGSTDAFEETVVPMLIPLLDAAKDNDGPRALADWLEAYSVIAGVADEDLADATADLLATSTYPAKDAISLLSVRARARLSLLLEDWPGGSLLGTDADAFSSEKAVSGMLAKSDAAARALDDPRPLLVDFVGKSVFTSSRNHPVAKGEMRVKDRSGKLLATFETNSGGGASSYRRTNGPTPPGYYRISNYRERTKHGFVRHGVGFSLDVDPVAGTSVFGRSLFRIHPDGASLGTNGCLGIFGNANDLARAREVFRELASDGIFLAKVGYSGIDLS